MSMNENCILIDAFSQIFRAFYAVKNLSNSQGFPTNALAVFTRLLFMIERCYPSDTGAMLFDCGKVQFRCDILPAYKANRPPMPDALRLQLPVIKQMASAFGWPLLQHDNYEADDLIAGLAHAYKGGGKVFIVSSDKDLSQLVSDSVIMLIPAAGGGFTARGKREVLEKFAVYPERICDYLALVGDSADNIPGVPGIGPKTAALMLNTGGGCAEWLAHPEKLQEVKNGHKILPYLDLIRKNLRLVALKDELPQELKGGDSCRRNPPDWDAVTEICRKYELHGVLKDIGKFCKKSNGGGDDLDLFAGSATARESSNCVTLPVQEELF